MAEVRAATPADIADAAELMVAAHRNHFPWLAARDPAASRARFQQRFQDGWQRLTVIGPIGQLDGLLERRGGYINLLFVRTPGAGTGTKLLRAGEAAGAWALECFVANERAQAFYRREGWVESSRYLRPFYGEVHQFLEFRRR